MALETARDYEPVGSSRHSVYGNATNDESQEEEAGVRTLAAADRKEKTPPLVRTVACLRTRVPVS